MMKSDYFVAIMVIGFLGAIYHQYNNPAQPAKNIELLTSTQAPKNIYVRPQLSPNGSVWPQFPSYIDGYAIAANQGLSDVTIDNTGNDADVYLKLVKLFPNKHIPVRHFFIPASKKFTLSNVSPGQYDIRYKDLSNGIIQKTEIFSIEEKRDYQGVSYSDLTIGIYKIYNGNMQTYSITNDEFFE